MRYEVKLIETELGKAVQIIKFPKLSEEGCMNICFTLPITPEEWVSVMESGLAELNRKELFELHKEEMDRLEQAS